MTPDGDARMTANKLLARVRALRAGAGELGLIPRIALSREDAAAALGMSLDSFERYVQPTIRMVRLGRMRFVAVADLERWLEDRAERTLTDAA